MRSPSVRCLIVMIFAIATAGTFAACDDPPSDSSAGESSGTGGSCSTASAATCSQAGSVSCGGTTCCPASNPYYCGATNLCYTSASTASTACAGSTCTACVTPLSSGGGGGGTCHNYTSCISFTPTWYQVCTSGGFETKPRNNCSYPVKIRVCLERQDGSASCALNFSLAPGQTDLGMWTCNATGRYVYWVVDPNDPSTCTGPSCTSYSACR